MKIKDLMLNDYVYYSFNGTNFIAKVLAILNENTCRVRFKVNGDCLIAQAKSSHLQLIPLTSSILEKQGFVKVGDEDEGIIRSKHFPTDPPKLKYFDGDSIKTMDDTYIYYVSDLQHLLRLYNFLFINPDNFKF